MEIRAIQNYINDAFGLNLAFKEWEGVDRLPLFLSKSAMYYSAKVDHRSILLIWLKNNRNFAETSNISKQIRAYVESESQLLFVLNDSTSYLRTKLIENRIAFVRPGRQVYAPFLGLIYSETRPTKPISRQEDPIDKMLTPSSLSLYLHLILNGFESRQQDTAFKLELSRMTLHRAYRELEQARLILRDEKTQKLSLPLDWKQQLKVNREKFKDPIRHVYYVDKAFIPDSVLKYLVESGESALSHYTMLSEPRHERYAVTTKTWEKIKSDIVLIPSLDEETVIIEVWSIAIPHRDKVVDPIALVFTMKDETDPRIDLALDQMIQDDFKLHD